jgi:hypothetical protein
MNAMKTILNREEREAPRRESPAGGLTETMPSGVAADVRRLERNARHPISLVTSAAASSGELQLHDSDVESRRLPVRHSRFLAYFAVYLSNSP